MNQSNPDVYRLSAAADPFRATAPESGEPKREQPLAHDGYDAERAEDFRRNREESRQLCEAFHAFYAANAAYHLEF